MQLGTRFGIVVKKTVGGYYDRKERIPVSKWTIVDLLGVVFCSFGGAVVFYITLLELLGDNKTTFSLARYVGSLLTIFLPLFGLRKDMVYQKKYWG